MNGTRLHREDEVAYEYGQTVIYTDRRGKAFIGKIAAEHRDATFTIQIDRPLTGGKLRFFDEKEVRVGRGQIRPM